MSRYQYDIIVIGAGAAGLNIMAASNAIGLSALLVTKTAEDIGGDCLHWGCVPSKALLHAAQDVYGFKKALRYGTNEASESFTPDPHKVFSHVRNSIGAIYDHENLDYFRKERGWEIVVGAAKFIGANTVAVEGTKYSAAKIVIATGSRPRELKVSGVEKVHVHTNETIFDLNSIPKKLLVVGGGPIGLELGQAFAMLGTHVTIVDAGSDFYAREHRDIANVLKQSFDDLEIAYICNAHISSFTDTSTAEIQTSTGSLSVQFDTVLAAIGREISYDELGLENAGIVLNERGIVASNEYMQTSNPNVFVVGDAHGSRMFTHAAEVHANVVMRNLFKPKLFWTKLSYDTFSAITYTEPQVASFGRSEQELSTAQVSFRTVTKDFAHNDRMITDEATNGLLRVHLDRKGRILGGSMVGKNAGELIQELILLMELGKPISTLLSKTYAYPTQTRINRELALSVGAERLTAPTKKFLHTLFKIIN